MRRKDFDDAKEIYTRVLNLGTSSHLTSLIFHLYYFLSSEIIIIVINLNFYPSRPQHSKHGISIGPSRIRDTSERGQTLPRGPSPRRGPPISGCYRLSQLFVPSPPLTPRSLLIFRAPSPPLLVPSFFPLSSFSSLSVFINFESRSRLA